MKFIYCWVDEDGWEDPQVSVEPLEDFEQYINVKDLLAYCKKDPDVLGFIENIIESEA